ncbi:transporter substrate-binding domain-containing protein [Microbulbifer sp. Q7]|uniref:transporter substrate-binding domain-containing protein n=1 Tax=Microbulbifer sp. Q7 TaxID=1785091 RepID=UPI00082F62E3|nr:transporter substrate-binding domain-containing protein [Microbulbifer sp. Q7]
MLFLCAFLVGCQDKPGDAGSAQQSPEEITKETDIHFQNYTETGDLSALKKRGTIRFITLATSEDDLLPRARIVTQKHYELAEALAKRLKLNPHWLAAASPADALEMIKSGRADVVVGNLTRTEERAQQFDLSEPITQSRQQLVTGRNGPDVARPDSLRNTVISIMEGSTYVDSARQLQEKIPGAKLEMRKLSKSDTVDRMIDNINQRENVVTIIDSNIVQGVLDYRSDLKAGVFVSDDEDIVWAMRKESPDLKLRINNFLTKKLVKAPQERKSDWPSIKKSRVIRFLTYNGPTSYFMWKGSLMGFDYDLAKSFAQKHNLELELIVVPHDQALTDWLQAGRGDFAGASTSITQERMAQGVDFTTPYIEMAAQVLSHGGKSEIKTLEDLNNRTLTLREFSIFEGIAKSLQENGIRVNVKVADPGVSLERIINMVADGKADATIADASAVEIAASLRKEVTAGPLVSDPIPQGWMVVKGNTSLKKRLNAFIKEYQTTQSFRKKVDYYFKPNAAGSEKIVQRLKPGEDLSPYDELAKQSARKFEFDWRLIVAQMWQESSFNPEAESPAGAQGLLQVMPRTAEEVGYSPPLFDPQRGIEAGVKYLSWIRDRFEPGISLEDRLWFSLAAYNAGIGHLYDAQRLAQELQLNPEVWFGNVEIAMLKLSEPRYFKGARYGYVRGAEPVQYVRNISQIYRAYTDITPGEIALQARYLPPYAHATSPRNNAHPKYPHTPSWKGIHAQPQRVPGSINTNAPWRP